MPVMLGISFHALVILHDVNGLVGCICATYGSGGYTLYMYTPCVIMGTHYLVVP